jgi:hypothetical protein
MSFKIIAYTDRSEIPSQSEEVRTDFGEILHESIFQPFLEEARQRLPDLWYADYLKPLQDTLESYVLEALKSILDKGRIDGRFFRSRNGVIT